MRHKITGTSLTRMDRDAIERTVEQLLKTGQGVVVDIERANSKRSLSQNALYWMWIAECVAHRPSMYQDQRLDHFRQVDFLKTRECWHDALRYLFLPSQAVVTPEGDSLLSLTSTTALNTAQMGAYMNKIEALMTLEGLLLPIPAGAEYEKYRAAS